MVAKRGLMLTHFGWETRSARVKRFEFKRDPDVPARKFLPEGETSIPSVVQDQNKRLNL
jgi:hypothetical protein